MRVRTIAAVVASGALLAAACSSGGDEAATDDGVEPTVEVAGAVQTATSTVPVAPSYDEDDLAAVATADDDRSFPAVAPETPVGVYGYSRYVWTQTPEGDVVPTLIEGPRGQQVRCQDEGLPCSMDDLIRLAEAGEPLPPELGLDDATLTDLADQLQTLRDYLAGIESIEEACALGYDAQSTQNPNMGIHMVNSGLVGDGFVVDRPEILLFAMEGNESTPRSQSGECAEDGSWTGPDGLEVVGAAYMVGVSDDHPEGFAGDLDNWHIHFNTCAGAENEVRSQSLGSRQACTDQGGEFLEEIPVWMMHAYAAEGFDSQQGVFAMFNGSIWPIVDTTALRDTYLQAPDGAVQAPITNFDFGDVTVDAGEPVVFTNSDGVPHTVSSGLPAAPTSAFDSGLLGGGQAWTTTFDDPGEYSIYCALHPQMTATVVVE